MGARPPRAGGGLSRDANHRGRGFAAAMSSFTSKLVKACPPLPYLALGVWLAWSYIAYSGTAWLSDTETDGTNISIMYMVSTVAFGASFALAAMGPRRAHRFVERAGTVVGGGALASLGCVAIILVGPYYLYHELPYAAVLALFYLGCAATGLGTAAIGLRCGLLYGSLPPRTAILYTAFSHVALALVYFTVIGSPSWQPIAGGPSLSGILAFAGMPLLASATVTLPAADGCEDEGEAPFSEDHASLPRPFWKLVAVTFVFSFVVSSLRSLCVEASPVDVTLDGTRVVMLLRIAVALGFAAAAVGVEGERFDFGRIYSAIMVGVVALIAFCPIVGVAHLVWTQLVTILSIVFEFVLWCILAFVVYQRRISAVLVFGFGYGAFMVGSGAGWIAGVDVFSILLGEQGSIFLFAVLAVAVLACAFLLFSEKEFDRLFRTEGDGEATLDDLLGDELSLVGRYGHEDPPPERKGRFGKAIEELSHRAGLSRREMDVFRCLAMGYDATATAKRLQVSWNTVRTHTRNVYAKLGVHSRQELIDLVDEATKRT